MKRNSVLFIHATERDVFMIVEGGQSEGAYFEVPVILMYAVANAGEGVGHKTRGIEIGLAGWLRHCTQCHTQDLPTPPSHTPTLLVSFAMDADAVQHPAKDDATTKPLTCSTYVSYTARSTGRSQSVVVVSSSSIMDYGLLGM